MKKVFILFITSLFLFCVIAPIFSFAVVVDPGFLVDCPLSESYFLSLTSDFSNSGSFYVAYDKSHAIWMGAYLEGNVSSYSVSLVYSEPYKQPSLKTHVVGSSGTSYKIYYRSINLVTGVVSNNVGSYTLNNSSTDHFRSYVPSSWAGFYVYGWSLFGEIVPSRDLFVSALDYVRFSRPLIADHVVNSYIPEPKADLSHYYVADSVYLYGLFIDYPVRFNYSAATVSSLTSIREYDMVVPELKKLNNTTVQVAIHNVCPEDINLFITKYKLVSGEYIESSINPIPVATSDDEYAYFSFTISSDDYMSIWYDGFVNTDGLPGFSRMAVRWSDTIDYSSDFLAVENLLNTIVTSAASIDSSVSSIFSTLSSLSSLLSSNWSWFKTSYYNVITSKWDLTFVKLDSIISILQGASDQTTLPHRDDVYAGVSGYIEQESGIMNSFDSAGSDVDQIFNDLDGRFEGLRSGFSVVSTLFETFVLENNFVLPLFLFSLSFGLVMLIIGRKAK